MMGLLLSTIVEIIKSLQTNQQESLSPKNIYDSRNYQVLIDKRNKAKQEKHLRQQKLSSPYRQHCSCFCLQKSTIVEIIKSLQTLLATVRLKEIYDSRNYQVLIDPISQANKSYKSTIVEIIKSLQTMKVLFHIVQPSTIVEIIKSLQTLIFYKIT